MLEIISEGLYAIFGSPIITLLIFLIFIGSILLAVSSGKEILLFILVPFLSGILTIPTSNILHIQNSFRWVVLLLYLFLAIVMFGVFKTIIE
jgi:hypothetical protein